MNKYSLSALFILALLITQSAAISSENVPSLQGTSDASSDRELLEEVHAEIESFANESDVVNVRELKGNKQFKKVPKIKAKAKKIIKKAVKKAAKVNKKHMKWLKKVEVSGKKPHFK